MKKWIGILITVVAVAAIAVLLAVFREPILDLLPIDQSGWQEKDGIRIYRDTKGDPVSGWLELDGKRFYLDESGAVTTGWLELDGKRYYLASDGAAVTGWHSDGGKRFYMDTDGSMVTGWMETGEGRCYFDADGAVHTGWLEDGGETYYLTDSGTVASGWLELDGKRYFMDPGAGCAMFTGWLNTSEGAYCFGEDGSMVTGWYESEDGRRYLDETGLLKTGWIEHEGLRYYLDEDGLTVQGWQEMEDGRRYFDEDGAMQTGWLETETALYYLTEDGIPAVGRKEIDGKNYYFTSTGANIILVNPWNYVPEGYTADIVVPENGGWVDRSCAAAVDEMLNACRAAGFHPKVASSYRTQADQTFLYNNMVDSKRKAGYADPYAEAAKIVAIPGTSEHQLGLALDIVDVNFTQLNEQQEKTKTQQWLMEHCWDYGFILRYPNGTTELTGIIYEPWHYRYVGKELSLELKELGICLEEYLDRLTNDGTSCGGRGK